MYASSNHNTKTIPTPLPAAARPPHRDRLPPLDIPRDNIGKLSVVGVVGVCSRPASASTAITNAHTSTTRTRTVSVAYCRKTSVCPLPSYRCCSRHFSRLVSFRFFPQSSGIVTARSFGNCEFVSNLYYIVIAKQFCRNVLSHPIPSMTSFLPCSWHESWGRGLNSPTRARPTCQHPRYVCDIGK